MAATEGERAPFGKDSAIFVTGGTTGPTDLHGDDLDVRGRRRCHDPPEGAAGPHRPFGLDGDDYDIVLTDLGLPDGSGTIVCESARLAGSRVIVMTANPVAAQLPEVRSAAEAVVSKPFDFTELVSLLDPN